MKTLELERRARLPHWAQNHIRNLESEIASLEALRSDLLKTRDPSRINANGYDDESPNYLNPHKSIHFDLSPENGPAGLEEIRVGLRKRGEQYVLFINGNGRIIITPNSSNDVDVTTDRW